MTQTELPAGPQVGAPAPEFTLRDHHGKVFRLADLRGRVVVLVFFPYAFTPTCTGELCAIRDDGAALSSPDVLTLGVSCDPGPALRVFAEQQGLDYPLLSDFWPHGEVSRAYGVFRDDRGTAMRGTFVIDRDGVLRWRVVNTTGDARNTEDYRRAIADL